VQAYLDKLAAKYEGVDQRLMAAIRTAAGETFRIEPTVDVRNSAAAALDDRLTETLTGYFLMRATPLPTTPPARPTAWRSCGRML